MAVVVSGSIAFDCILTFAGRFSDHIVPGQTHILNLSFLVDSLEKRRGGVAGNYAYSLALLGQPAAILATAGADAADYRAWLESQGIDCGGLRLLDDAMTATGFTTTDLDDNQITGYYGGAMMHAATLGLADTVPDPLAVIVGPNHPAAMLRLVGECRKRRIPWVFDPSHQLPHLSAEELEEGSRGAWILIGNDYEMELIQQRTRRDVAGLLRWSGIVVTTRGRHGSRLATRDGTVEVPAAVRARVVDPTGAGDAYRAGLVAGLLRGQDLERAARIASVAASYVIEQTGTVEHRYSLDEFAARYAVAYREPLPEGFRRRPVLAGTNSDGRSAP